jgi:transcriptional regulator with XRE-family HTH domain
VATVTEDNQDARETVARNIRVQREQVGLSTRRLAKLAGIDERGLRRYERGDSEPSARTMLKLMSILGQSLEWYYKDHDDEGSGVDKH